MIDEPARTRATPPNRRVRVAPTLPAFAMPRAWVDGRLSDTAVAVLARAAAQAAGEQLLDVPAGVAAELAAVGLLAQDDGPGDGEPRGVAAYHAWKQAQARRAGPRPATQGRVPARGDTIGTGAFEALLAIDLSPPGHDADRTGVA